MENLYFPMFLGAMAVLVIWLYFKSQKAQERAEDRKYQAKFGQQRNTRQNRTVLSSHSRSKRAAAAGLGTSERMWSARHRRARHSSTQKGHSAVPESKTIQANYIGPSLAEQSGRGEHWSVRDQDVDPVDYVGFDEYTAKRRAEVAAKSAQEADEFSMTAIKFDSQDQDREDEKKGEVKRAGFKP